MKKFLLLIYFLGSFTTFVRAQTYTLTRVLPVAEIAGTGTAITGLGDDNSVGPFNIGFNFTFMGTAYTQFYLGSNGIITFGLGSNVSNITIPNSSFGRDLIAFACTDQDPRTSAGTPIVNYFTSGTAPNRILVLNYRNVQRLNAPTNITTVQVQLYENNGKIEIHSTLNASNGSTRTIGIQNANGSESYTSTALNNASSLSANNEMIRFSLPTPCTHSVAISSSTTNICDGQTVNLTSTTTPTGTYTYQWLKNNTEIAGATSATYAANTTGAYKLRVTNSSSCQSFSNTITINKQFTPTLSTSSWYTCISRTATVAPTGTYTYQWFKSNTAVSGATTSSLTPSTTGYYKVRATSGSCSVTSDSVNVLQNVLTASGGTGYTCAGITLNASLSGSTMSNLSFLWTGPNTFTSSSSNPQFSNLTNANQGTYTVRAISAGCNTLTATANLTVQPNTLTAYSGTGNVCGGTDLGAYFSSSTPSGTTFSWAGPGGYTSTSQYPRINNLTAAQQGTYTITATIPNCGTQTATTFLTVQPLTLTANGGSGYVCSNASLSSFVLGSSSGITYSWTGPNGFTSTAQYPQVTSLTFAKQGIYTVVATVPGCTTLTATANLTVNPNALTVNSGTGYTCGSINLSAYFSSTPSNATFSWTGPNGYTSTLNYPQITNLTTAQQGVYTITATIPGCTTVQGTTLLTIQPIVLSASGRNTYSCLNASLSAGLSTSPTNPPSYSWTGPNNFTSTSSSPSLSPTNVNQQGIYTVQVVIPSCTNLTATSNVSVQPFAVTAANRTGYICGNVSLSPNVPCCSNPSTTYSWSGPNNFSSTDQYPTLSNLTPAQQGIYTIRVTVAGCATVNATSNLTVSTNTGDIGYTGSSYICGTRQLSFYPSAGTISPTAYLWTGPNNFSSTLSSPQIPNQTFANSGVYTLQVTFSSCGVTTVTSNITVQPNTVNISNIYGNTRCPGENIELLAITDGSGTISYSWSGPGGFTSTLFNPNFILSASNTGVYSVIATFAGCSTASATTLISIQSFTVDAGIDRSLVCPLNTVALEGRISGSSIYNPPSPTTVSFQWSGPNGFSSTGRNPSLPNVTTASSGFYTLNAVFSNGCVGTSSSIVALNVRDNPEMFVSGGGAYCSGESATIIANANNYLGNTNVAYQWTGPDNFSSTLRNPTISSVGSGGVYTISATFSNGCTGTYTNLVHIFSRRKPSLSASNTTVCLGNGNTIYLYSSTDATTNNSFSWQGPDSFGSTIQNPFIAGATNARLGVYTVSLTRTGCPETSSATATVSLASGCNPTTTINCYVGASNNNSNACPGSNIILSTNSNAPGATSLSYTWAGPNGFTANNQTVTINNATATQVGYYTVTMTITGGTCNGGVYTAQTYLGLKPSTNTPTLGFSGFGNCEGNYFALYKAVSNGAFKQYSITGPNGFTFLGKSNGYDYFYGVIPSQSGTYIINAIMNGECQSSTTDFPISQTYNITVSPRPIAPSISASANNIQSGQTVTLTGSGCSNQINWSVGSMTGFTYNYTTANPFIDTPPATTTYWAICKSTQGCLSPSSNRVLVSLGCNNMQSIQSGLWTNPSIWSCGSVPTSSNITTISVGHIVTIPASTNAFVRNLLNYGTLKYEQNSSLRLGQ